MRSCKIEVSIFFRQIINRDYPFFKQYNYLYCIFINRIFKDWKNFIIIYEKKVQVEDFGFEVEERRIGGLTIGQLDHWSPEIGYYIGEKSLWGKGIGKEVVKAAMEWIKEYGRDYTHTTVKDDNERSIRLLTSLGFERLGPARPGESWYQKKI